MTRPGYEGKQFGTTLGLLADDVIGDLLTRRPEQFYDVDKVYAAIVDDAHPADPESGVVRTGWTSSLAKKLGYERTEDYQGRPQYTKEY